MTHTPFFSIILPVYNVENYLFDCVQSIVNQTYNNFELIAVEDCSTDSSRWLLKDYSRKYPIRIIELEKNSGLGNARNVGFMNAVGEYVLFVDSDDQIEPKLLEKLKSIYENSDVIIFNFYREWLSGKKKNNLMTSLLEELSTHPIYENDVENKSKMFTNSNVAWNKAYRRSFLLENGIYFDNGLYEDIFFNYMVIIHSRKIVVTPFLGYKYLQRDASILNCKSDGHADLITQYKKLFEYLNQNNFDGYHKKTCEVFISHLFNLVVRQHYRLTWRAEKEILHQTKVIIKNISIDKSFEPTFMFDKFKLKYLNHSNRYMNLLLSFFERFFKLVFDR